MAEAKLPEPMTRPDVSSAWMRRAVTAMSERRPAQHVISGTYLRVARNSLVLSFVLAASHSCIVTGSPDFSDDQTTKPILTVVQPQVTELLCVQGDNNVYPPQSFQVLVGSEDTEESPLTAVLLLDYGTPTNIGEDAPQPWRDVVSERGVPVGSLNDEPRTVSLTWLPDEGQSGSCHSLTMMVVRNRFRNPPYFHCPVDDQFATVTWYAALEQDGTCDFSTCPIAGQGGPEDFVYCPDPQVLRDMLDPANEATP